MKQSAGILLYKIKQQQLFVLLVHPGGPYWAKKDLGAWSLPKGEFTNEEEPLAAAKREFFEETGFELTASYVPLKPLKQKSGKLVYAWAAEGDLDATKITSNTCTIEWPPRSGKTLEIPEIDAGAWFSTEEGLLKIAPSQQGFIMELEEMLSEQNLIKRDKNNTV